MTDFVLFKQQNSVKTSAHPVLYTPQMQQFLPGNILISSEKKAKPAWHFQLFFWKLINKLQISKLNKQKKPTTTNSNKDHLNQIK